MQANFMRNQFWQMQFLLIALLTNALGLQTHAQVSSEQTSRRCLDVIDLVLAHHIDPPTRQQMLLCGARAVFDKAGERPRDLSQSISKLSSDQQFTAFLDSIIEQFSETPFVQGVSAFASEQELADCFVTGMLECLPGGGRLLAADEARVQEQLDANRYVGIGIALTTSDGEPRISKLFYDGPGFKAGVLEGDSILEIDDSPTKGKDLTEIVHALRGEAGTQVKLLLKQPSDAAPREITVTRNVTFIPTIEGVSQERPGEWQYELDASRGIFVLNIKQVGPSSVHELNKIEVSLRGKAVQGIILDLRNASGTLHDIVLLADQFLDRGAIVKVKTGNSSTTHSARPGSLFSAVPMVVLVSPSSSTGAKFLAAALRDQERALVVGQMSAGPDYVHSRIALPSGEISANRDLSAATR